MADNLGKLKCSVDMTEFEKCFRKYMDYTSRSLTEAVNQHAYYIARNATFTTKGGDKEQIKTDLLKPSDVNPDAPLAAILVNVRKAKSGKPGLCGEDMKKAVEKYVRWRQSHRNFLRSGWLPAIKALAALVRNKGGQKIPSYTKQYGKTKGGASVAKGSFQNWSPIAVLWNAIEGGKSGDGGEHAEAVREFLMEGAQEAIDKERENMRQYIEKKIAEGGLAYW